MPLQLALVGKILWTETAPELLDASVLDEMSAKVDAGRESFPADIAVVLVDVAMSFDMLLIAVEIANYRSTHLATVAALWLAGGSGKRGRCVVARIGDASLRLGDNKIIDG